MPSVPSGSTQIPQHDARFVPSNRRVSRRLSPNPPAWRQVRFAKTGPTEVESTQSLQSGARFVPQNLTTHGRVGPDPPEWRQVRFVRSARSTPAIVGGT